MKVAGGLSHDFQRDSAGSSWFPDAEHNAARSLPIDDGWRERRLGPHGCTKRIFHGPASSGPSPSRAFRKQAKQDNKAPTLTGLVEWEFKPLAWDCDVPNCDHFALYDDATHANHELDDARAALP